MICIALAVKREQHFEVDILSKIFRGKLRTIHKTIMLFFSLVGGAVIVWASIDFVALGLLKKSPAIDVSMVYIYLSLLFGGVLVLLMALHRIIHVCYFKELGNDT